MGAQPDLWDCSHFPRAKRVAYAIVDVVTRYQDRPVRIGHPRPAVGGEQALIFERLGEQQLRLGR